MRAIQTGTHSIQPKFALYYMNYVLSTRGGLQVWLFLPSYQELKPRRCSKIQTEAINLLVYHTLIEIEYKAEEIKFLFHFSEKVTYTHIL